MSNKSRGKQLLVLGSYGQHNTGDEGLLAVMIDQLQNYQLVVNSHDPQWTQRKFNVLAFKTHHLKDLLVNLLKCDAVVYGGGTIIVETPRVLFLMAGGNLLARLLGKRVAYLGVGVGFLGNNRLVKFLARSACSWATLITLRDSASADELRRVGVRRPLTVAADPILLLKPAPRQPALEILKAEGIKTDHNLIGVAPRFHDSPANYQKMLRGLAQACDYLIETHQAQIILLPIQHRFYYNETYADWKYDDTACQELFDLISNQEQVKILTEEYRPDEVLTIVGLFKIFIAAPLHPLMFALKQSVPMIGLDYSARYSSKIAELFKRIDQQEYRIGSYARADFATLKKMIDQTFLNFNQRKDTLKSAATRLEKEARRSFALFSQLLIP